MKKKWIIENQLMSDTVEKATVVVDNYAPQLDQQWKTVQSIMSTLAEAIETYNEIVEHAHIEMSAVQKPLLDKIQELERDYWDRPSSWIHSNTGNSVGDWLGIYQSLEDTVAEDTFLTEIDEPQIDEPQIDLTEWLNEFSSDASKFPPEPNFDGEE